MTKEDYQQEVLSLTDAQLERNLITVDYRGVQFKTLCLNELINRKRKSYYDGIIEGLTRYAWWKNGIQFVGTCGSTLKDAITDVEVERNTNAMY